MTEVPPPPPHLPRDASEGKGPQRRPQKRLDRRLEEVAKAGGGYCRLQMPLRLALGVRGTVAGHRPGGLKGGTSPPFQCIPPCPPPLFSPTDGPDQAALTPPPFPRQTKNDRKCCAPLMCSTWGAADPDPPGPLLHSPHQRWGGEPPPNLHSIGQQHLRAAPPPPPPTHMMTAYRALIRPSGEDAMGRVAGCASSFDHRVAVRRMTHPPPPPPQPPTPYPLPLGVWGLGLWAILPLSGVMGMHMLPYPAPLVQ